MLHAKKRGEYYITTLNAARIVADPRCGCVANQDVPLWPNQDVTLWPTVLARKENVDAILDSMLHAEKRGDPKLQVSMRHAKKILLPFSIQCCTQRREAS